MDNALEQQTSVLALTSETIDVKPRIRPFPLDAPDEANLTSTGSVISQKDHTPTCIPSAVSGSSETPDRFVKKEPSPLSSGNLLRATPGSPIYISSDSDEEEVYAQIKSSQPGSESPGEPDPEVEKDELEEEGEESQSDGEQDQSQGDAERAKSVANSADQANSSQKPASRRSSPSRSPSPFFSSLPVRPKPKAVSLSQPPADIKKRSCPTNDHAASQQVASSSRLSQGRTSVTAEPRGSVAALNGASIHFSDEEEDKRYAKRARTSVSSAEPARHKAQKRRTRNPKYWFLDGSVVLQLGDVMFRLHRSRLANQSTYFQELFSEVPSNDNSDIDFFDFVDKCPVFNVKGVAVRDFEELLVALDNAISYVFNPPEFSQLASILRAAQTLCFTALEDFASRTLRDMWPQELNKLTAARKHHASETIILARECDMPELLKRAFYELLRSARLGEDEDADSDDPDTASTQISRQDLARLIKAREELVARWICTAGRAPDILCPLAAVDPPNDEGLKCIQARANNFGHWHEAVKKSLFEECLYDPLIGLERLAEIKWEDLGYCRGCVKAWRDSWTAQRVKLWQQLDLWLGLPTDNDRA